MLLARRVLGEIDDALDGGDLLPRRPCLSVVRQFAASSPDLANERGPPWDAAGTDTLPDTPTLHLINGGAIGCLRSWSTPYSLLGPAAAAAF